MVQITDIWDNHERGKVEWILTSYCCVLAFLVFVFALLNQVTNWFIFYNLLSAGAAYMLSRLTRHVNVQMWRNIAFCFLASMLTLVEVRLVMLLMNEGCLDVDHKEAYSMADPICKNVYRFRIFPPQLHNCMMSVVLMAVFLFQLHWKHILLLIALQLIVFATTVHTVWPSTPLERNNVALVLGSILQVDIMAIVYQRAQSKSREVQEHEKIFQELHVGKGQFDTTVQPPLSFAALDCWGRQERREIEMFLTGHTVVALAVILIFAIDGAPIRFTFFSILACAISYKMGQLIKQVPLQLWRRYGILLIVAWNMLSEVKLAAMLMDEVCALMGDHVEAEDMAYPICANIHGLRIVPPRLRMTMSNAILMALFLFRLDWKRVLLLVGIQMIQFVTIAYTLWPSTWIERDNLQLEFVFLAHTDLLAILYSYHLRGLHGQRTAWRTWRIWHRLTSRGVMWGYVD